MYRAAFLTDDFDNPAPNPKELKYYLGKSAKLLHASDQRKTKNTPYADQLHLIIHSFSCFGHLFFPRDGAKSTKLYIFDEKINETHFFLKYATQVVTHFSLDERIIDEMYTVGWGYGHLKRYLRSLESELRTLDFFIKNNIGESQFHKSFPQYVSSSKQFMLGIEKEIQNYEDRANKLFRSGWT